jgi:photosystem II stability/assembly factor-like uncharacterized protein
MIKKSCYLVFVLLCLCFNKQSAAQKHIPQDLQQQLRGKTKLSDIMQVVDAYYDNGRKNIARDEEEGEGVDESNEYVHWKRWEWWMSSHLDANGNFVPNLNRLNHSALYAEDRKWGAAFNNDMQQSRSMAPQRTALEIEQLAMSGRAGNGGEEPNNLSYGNWTVIGPTADGTGPGDIKGLGRFDRIAFHPTNANTFYVGAPSGNLWKTMDGGSTWASVTDGLANPGVAGIAISPTNGNIVYMLTGDGDSYNPGYFVYDYGSSRASIGVFKSTDGGTTWNSTGALFTGGDYEGHRLRVSPTNGNYLFATTSQGIYRTTDGGTTWTQVKTGEHWDIEFKPNNDSVVYATSGSAIFYSTQGGRTGTWLTATTDFSVAGARRIELATSPNNANYVYALCGAAGSGTFTGIFRSVNNGVDYTRRTNTPNILNSSTTGTGSGEQSDYDLGICVKPTDAERIATCGLCVWRSNGSNGGTAMVFSTVYRESFGPGSAYIHPDVHDVQYNPLNNILYAATDGGVYRSSDDGVNWTNISAGLTTSQFYGLSMRDANADGEGDGVGFLTGAQDNGMKYRSNAGPSVFAHVICCDGYGTAIDADDPNVLYMNINNGFYRSLDGGFTAAGLLTVTFFSPLCVDYTDPDTMYIGGSTTRRTFNGTAASPTYSNFTGNTRRVLTNCPSNQARLYGSGGTSLIRSDDRAATWTTKSGTPGWPVGTFTINDIDVYPTNSLEVYACFGGYSAGNKVMRSVDGGDNWTNWSGSLPNLPCYGLAVATEGVYVGTEIGVYFRGYTMTDWVPFYNGMPRTPVTELAVNSNGLIYASTFGRGTWLGNRRSACTNVVTISGSRTGQYYYEASSGVNATITATGSSGDEIYSQAGDSVVMRPGFEMKAGTYFKAYIAPCSNGGIPVASRSGEANNNVVMAPRINEVKPGTKNPASTTNYFSIADGKIEFSIKEKGTIEMFGKQTDGTWKSFYPPQTLYPGFYHLPAPNAFTGEVKVKFNRSDLQRL